MLDKTKLPVVTSARLFTNLNTLVIDQHGLLSEVFFGPRQSYKCACGKFTSKTLHKDKQCQVCKVYCSSNDSRYVKFAKIKLPYPYIKWTKKKNFHKCIKKKHRHLLDSLQSDLTTTTQSYLSYSPANDEIKITETYNSGTCIPLTITGNYTLYIALKFLSQYSSAALELLNNFDFEIIVVPPNCRLTTINEKNGKKQIITHDIDKLYIKILRLCNFTDKKSYTPKQELESYGNMIQTSMDNGSKEPIVDEALNLHDEASSKFQYYCNEVYKACSESLSHKKGSIRND